MGKHYRSYGPLINNYWGIGGRGDFDGTAPRFGQNPEWEVSMFIHNPKEKTACIQNIKCLNNEKKNM